MFLLARLFCSISAQSPARNPPKKTRWVGSKVFGNQVWKKQIEDQAVAIDPVRKVDMRRALEIRFCKVETGK